MNVSTKMEMSQVNKPANNVQTMQYVKINIQTCKHLTVTFLKRIAISHSYRIWLTDSIGALRQVKFNVDELDVVELQHCSQIRISCPPSGLQILSTTTHDNNNKVINTLGIRLQHLYCTRIFFSYA